MMLSLPNGWSSYNNAPFFQCQVWVQLGHSIIGERRLTMNYFVTGATGFVGGALVRNLRAQGHEVHASVRNPDKAKDLQDLGTKLFKGDVTDKESMRAAMQDVDGIFHVAGWYKIGAK